MRFLFSIILLINLFFFLSCKTATEEEPKVSSSPPPVEEPEEEVEEEKPQSIVVPVASLGDVSDTRKKILQNTLEDELKYHFKLISQERFEEAQEKAFEELDYEECTEDQCIMMIQEMLQVENVFHLEVIGEGSDTQLSLSWRTLDEKKKEEQFCENCKTVELRKLIGGLVGNLLGLKKEISVQSDPNDEDKIDEKIKIIDNSNQNKGYCDIICEGLIGHFSFNNDFEDSTNNFQKTEVFGDKIRFTEKNKNTGISFNGENGLILRSNKFDTNTSFTFFAVLSIESISREWIFDGRNNNTQQILINNPSNDFFINYYFFKDGNSNLKVQYKRKHVWRNKKVPAKRIHSIAVSLEETKNIVNIYLDGYKYQQINTNESERNQFSANEWFIGGEKNGVRGTIYELRFYNRNLSSSEIKDLSKNRSY